MSLRQVVEAAIRGDGSHSWADRVVEFQGALPDEELPPVGELPFVMYKFVSDDPGQFVQNQLAIEVWPHVENNHFSTLDTVSQELVPLLDHKLLVDPVTGQGYTTAYTGVAVMDSPVRSWDAYSRPERFTIQLATWLVPGDPRTDALSTFVTGLFGDQVATVTNALMPDDTHPGVYFKPVSDGILNEGLSTMGMDVFDEVLSIHIIAPSPAARQPVISAVARSMRRAAVPYGGHTLPAVTVQGVNMAADPQRDGQIRVVVSYPQLTPAMVTELTAPPLPLRHIHLVETATGERMEIPRLTP